MGKAKAKIHIQKIDNYVIPSYAKVKVTTMGNVVNVKYVQRRNDRATIKKVDEDHYMVIKSGEIREYSHTENRSQNTKGVRESLVNLRAILNTNVLDVSKCRWVTYTYQENMMDTERLYEDFKRFMKELRKWGKTKGYDNIEYIIACEPQLRGAWHIHAVMIFDKKAPYIPNVVPQIYDKDKTFKQNLKALKKHKDFNSPLLELWGHGWVTVRPLKDIDNVGAYLSAYMCDIKMDEETENMDMSGYEIVDKPITGADGKIESKKFAKGARLHLYPTNFNIWRTSRGIKKPDIEYMSNYKAQKKVSSGKLTYESTIQLTAEDDSFTNIINNKYYNLVRANSQDDCCKNASKGTVIDKNVNEKMIDVRLLDRETGETEVVAMSKSELAKLDREELKICRERNRKKIEEDKLKEQNNPVKQGIDKHVHDGKIVERLKMDSKNITGMKMTSIGEMWVLPRLVGKMPKFAERMRAKYLYLENKALSDLSDKDRSNAVKRILNELNKVSTLYWVSKHEELDTGNTDNKARTA